MIEQAKLTTPSDESGSSSRFGWSVAVSSDGSTALIGGWADSNGGAAWVYTRSGSSWSEQQKLTPSDETGSASEFGYSVALSSDGSTALIGGWADSSGGGAAWVYTRSGSSWSEQQKLTSPSDRNGGPGFGFSVALSSDGSTALIGGFSDNGLEGAAWVYTRQGSAWSEQQKLTPSDETGSSSQFGWSVALSSDGSTALIGGPNDNNGGANNGGGAAWVYTRSGFSWSEQQKLTTPSDETSPDQSVFGYSVALSSDGSTALIGGPNDNNGGGAAWVYTRSGSVWSEQQDLATPSDENGAQSEFGFSVALSSDGSTALIGGPYDNNGGGAVWVYTRSGSLWSEQQDLATPSDETSPDQSVFGLSVALSSDGSTALIGGPYDNSLGGAVWAYVVRAADTSAPSISIAAPARGSYTRGETVDANYSCTDPDGASDVATCTGPVPAGSPIRTGAVGKHTFTVTASDQAGNHSSVMHHYTVFAANGSGQITVTPSNVGASSKHHTLMFAYKAARGGIWRGELTLTVPPGWSAPSTRPSAPGYVAASEGRLTIAGRTITVSIPILASRHTLTIAYGSRDQGSPGASASSAPGTQTWGAQEKSIASGKLTNLAAPPQTTTS